MDAAAGSVFRIKGAIIDAIKKGKRMTAEEYLQSIRDMRYKISILEREKYLIMIPSASIKYDDMRVQTSPRGDSLEVTVIHGLEEIKRIDRQINATKNILDKRQSAAFEDIMRMKEGQNRRFLVDYYFYCESISKIAKEYGFTNKKTVYSLKKRAIKNFEKLYKKC